MFWVAAEEQKAVKKDEAQAAGTQQVHCTETTEMQGKRLERHSETSRLSLLKWPLLLLCRLWRPVDDLIHLVPCIQFHQRCPLPFDEKEFEMTVQLISYFNPDQSSSNNSQPNLPSAALSSRDASKHWAASRTSMAVDTNSWLPGIQKRNNKVVPFTSKIRERHLELEPLCCLSSCLVRGGCTAVAAFEYTYVVFTVIAVILRMHSDGYFRFWSPLKMSYDSMVTHNAVLYILLGYDLVTVTMATGLLRALLNFDRHIARVHLYFDYFALAFNLTASILYISAMLPESSEARTFPNMLLLACFLSHIPLQLWAISVVRSCLEFFILVHVFVEMAEK